jgi:hypothetical protein
MPPNLPVRRRRSRQVHIFLSDQQYLWVVAQAKANDETISRTIRRFIHERQKADSKKNLGP